MSMHPIWGTITVFGLGENDRSEQLTQLQLISPREKTKLLM